MPAWFWDWAAWHFGLGQFKGHAQDPALRPADAPHSIPRWAFVEAARRFTLHDHKAPVPSLDPVLKPSWTIPGPVVFTENENPDVADNVIPEHFAVGKIVPGTEGLTPLWKVDFQGQVGYIAQVEGQGQVQQAVEKLSSYEGSLAVVTTLGSTVPDFLRIGVNYAFVECYAEAGAEPYGDADRMTWQAHHDGWPFAKPVFGIYNMPDGTPKPLSDYPLADWDVYGIWVADNMAQGNNWQTFQADLRRRG